MRRITDHLGRTCTAALAIGAVWLVLRAWAALRPTAYPYFARALLDVPRPLTTRRGLLEILAPAPGERILEIGPGTGYYTLPVARRLGPDGVLDVVDVRQRYLDHTMARARHAGLTNVVPALGDGGSLPFPDETFDAAFLVSTLGEIPEPQGALRDLRRVIKPGGRVVIGELFIDPDFPRRRWLVARAREAGLGLDRCAGSPLAYYVRFRAQDGG